MALIGIAVFGFALEGATPEEMKRFEPNPCNIRLGLETVRIARKYPEHRITAQWEVATWLRSRGETVDRSVELREDGVYLDTRGVWKAARADFKAAGITDVVLIAQPWMHLHLGLARHYAKQDGFHVIRERVQPIGFDDSDLNSQEWTTSGPKLLVYTVKKILKRDGGHHGRQVADSKSPA